MLSPRLKLLGAVAALAVACFIVASQLHPLYQPSDQVLEETYGDARVLFVAERTVILFSTDCIPVRWETEGIQTVKLDGQGVVGEGMGQSCRPQETELQVQFQVGTSEDYDIQKVVLLDRFTFRLLIVVAVGLAALGLGLLASLLPWAKLVKLYSRRLQPGKQSFPPTATALSRLDLSLVVLLLLWGIALRILYLSQTIRADEAWSYVAFASQPLDVGLVSYWTTNNHIFHNLLMHLSDAVFGNQEWMLRLPAFFGGILMIAAAFRAGRSLAGTRVALLATAFIATASPLILYSTNARGYTIIGVLFLLQVVLGTYLRRRNDWVRWLLFSLFGVYSLYTIPTAVYGLIILYLWLGIGIILDNRGKSRIFLLRSLVLSGLLMGMVTGLLYLPVLLYMTSHTFEVLDLGWFNPTTWADFARFFDGTMAGLREWHVAYPIALVGLLWIGFAVDTLIPDKSARLRWRLVMVVLLGVIPLGIVLLVRSFPRVWLFLFPLYLIIAVAGVSRILHPLLGFLRLNRPRLSRGLVAVGVPGLALLLGIATISSRAVLLNEESVPYQGAEETAQALAQVMTDSDSLICGGSCWVLRYYLIADHEVPEIANQLTHAYRGELAERIILLAIDEPEVADVIQSYDKVPLEAYTEPELLAHFDDTYLYAIERLDGRDQAATASTSGTDS